MRPSVWLRRNAEDPASETDHGPRARKVGDKANPSAAWGDPFLDTSSGDPLACGPQKLE